ncbi:MAG: N-acetylmuramoyl-L-alanine amidase [Opitutaceae bacterium]|nr:N-acetylmuramoyl-L-alanine amidase [Opitutaceae bacterium]
MITAAGRFHFLRGSVLWLGALCCLDGAGEATARSAPSRPGAAAAGIATATPPPLPSRRFGAIGYVNLADGASRLGLKLAWVSRGKKVKLTGPRVTAEIATDTREINVNGMRVFLGDPVADASGKLYVSRIDFERCLTPLLRPGFGVTTVARPKTIVLDPGHGGKDTGTSDNEKIYALDVAKRARKELEAAGYRVVLTRESDTFVELVERPAIANATRADVFVSIHFNALIKDRKTSGVEIFTFAPQHQRSADSWSPGKKDDTFTHAEPNNRFDHWNMVLAQTIHRRFLADLKTFDRGKKLAHWGVLRSLNCPGVLVECGFLTSDAEARKIATPAYRQKLAQVIAAGIREYSATVEGLRWTASARR